VCVPPAQLLTTTSISDCCLYFIINISVIVATLMRCGGSFNYHLTANLLLYRDGEQIF